MTELTYSRFHKLWSGSVTPGIASDFAIGNLLPFVDGGPLRSHKDGRFPN